MPTLGLSELISTRIP